MKLCTCDIFYDHIDFMAFQSQTGFFSVISSSSSNEVNPSVSLSIIEHGFGGDVHMSNPQLFLDASNTNIFK